MDKWEIEAWSDTLELWDDKLMITRRIWYIMINDEKIYDAMWWDMIVEINDDDDDDDVWLVLWTWLELSDWLLLETRNVDMTAIDMRWRVEMRL